MIPQLNVEGRTEHKRRMNELLQFDVASTAVLTIDMQNDYLDMTCGTALVDPEEAKRVIYHAGLLLDFARAHQLPVIHVYVQRRPEEAERYVAKANIVTTRGSRDQLETTGGRDRSKANRVVGTPQAEIPVSLVAPGDLHVTGKRVMDGFFGTELNELLAEVFKVKTVVITGVNTDTCVYATTFGASIRNFQPIVISDCVASNRGTDQHWMALELMARSISWVMTVDEFKEKLTTSL